MSELAILFAVCAGGTLAAGGPLIALLRRLSYRQQAYEDAPSTHAVKSGTPTMGGLLFVLAVLVVAVWHPGPATEALALLGLTAAAVGAVDDLTKIRGMRNRGLSAPAKFALTIGAALLFLVLVPSEGGTIFRWGARTLVVPAPLWYVLGVCAVLATTHAVNLTDGLDGLAAGTAIPPLAVLAWIAWRIGQSGVAYMDVAVIAALLGFLVYNRHPAKLFMGDTGSLLLGGITAGSAVLTGTHLLLLLIGGVFVAEALSVIIQVTYYKRTHKRIFRMSPLHHHFELGGWPETTVTQRFWTASALLSLAGAAIVR